MSAKALLFYLSSTTTVVVGVMELLSKRERERERERERDGSFRDR